MDKYLKNRKVKLYFKENIEPHEILLDNLAKKNEEDLGIKEQKLEVPLLNRNLFLLFYFFILVILVLFGRTFQLQVVQGSDWVNLARENKFISRKIQVERGVIYDRNFKQLVSNKPSFDLFLEKNKLPQSDEERKNIFREVSQILKLSDGDLDNKVRESKDSLVPISENLDEITLVILETKIEKLTGFKIVQNLIRDYKDGDTFSHLIGYIGKIKGDELKANSEFYSIFDYVGKEGVEKTYEDVLRKNPGEMRIEKDAMGNTISSEIISSPESGKSLLLWLDSDLQKKIKEELEKELQVIGTDKAMAVALDPKTGGVLALVNIPTFDNNLFQKGTDPDALAKLFTDEKQALFNRVISGQYPTGSSIKPLIASAALQERIINPLKKISDEPGYIEVPNPYNPAITYKYMDNKIHGDEDMRGAIAVSCNVYFYTIGGGYGDQKGLGPGRIKKYLELFGWGAKTNIDLPGETKGFLPSPEWKKKVKKESWWDGDTYNISIGQGDILASPLQVASSIAVIANGGRLLQPQTVKAILNNREVVTEFDPKVIREDFIDPENIEVVREGMRQTVTAGSATGWLDGLAVKAAAKTGTAQTREEDTYLNWITVFAPYENPQIVLTVMFENVKGVKATALPVAKNVLEWYFSGSNKQQ